MKQILLAISIALLCVLTACNESPQSIKEDTDGQTPTQQGQEVKPTLQTDVQNETETSDIAFLNDLAGKYPYAIKLLEKPTLKRRLQALLGKEYDFVTSIYDTQGPIKVEDGFFYSWGMKAHSGGDPSAMIMADLEEDVLYVRIFKDGAEKLYSEDDSMLPPTLQTWVAAQ